MIKILLVEDNKAIIMGLKFLFDQEKMDCKIAENKKETIKKLQENIFDIVLLDITLPDGNGFGICEKIKKEYKIPVIFLTAKDEEKDVVLGLDIGADDYIIKPFRNRELISRIKTVLRRNGNSNDKIIKCDNIKIDTIIGKVYVNEKEIIVTKLEYKILINLLSNQNRLISREEILNDIWDIAGNFVNDNTLTVYIKRIREKIGDKEGNIIKTVRGLGYRVGEKDENIKK